MGIINCNCNKNNSDVSEFKFENQKLTKDGAVIRLQNASRRFISTQKLKTNLHEIITDKMKKENMELKRISIDEFNKVLNENLYFNQIYENYSKQLENSSKDNTKECIFSLDPIKITNLTEGTEEFYNGSFNSKGEFSGRGIHLFPNNGIYVGEFLKDDYNGIGLMITNRGDSIFGEWKDGLCSGNGELNIINQLNYKGGFKEHKKNGYGVEQYENGAVYEGNFIDGVKSGKGKYRLPNGESYEGDFDNDIYNGIGKYQWKNENRTYEGQFKDGYIEGSGINKFPDGSVYKGSYIKGIKQGKGCYKWPNGKMFFGNWLNGELHGAGYYVINNNQFDVTFRFGKLIIVKSPDVKNSKNYNQINEKNMQFNRVIFDKDNLCFINSSIKCSGGGNNNDLNHKYLDKYLCTLCQKVLINPMKCNNCFKKYCKDCIFNEKSNEYKQCLNCGGNIFETDLDILFELMTEINLKCPQCFQILDYNNAVNHYH